MVKRKVKPLSVAVFFFRTPFRWSRYTTTVLKTWSTSSLAQKILALSEKHTRTNYHHYNIKLFHRFSLVFFIPTKLEQYLRFDLDYINMEYLQITFVNLRFVKPTTFVNKSIKKKKKTDFIFPHFIFNTLDQVQIKNLCPLVCQIWTRITWRLRDVIKITF